VLTGTSKLALDIRRDREGTFDPKLIAKYQRRFPDFDSKIISMYARGMTVREIRGHLEELYGIDVSPDLISTITDAVLESVAEWQGRPLDACYPLVFFDAIWVKIRDEGSCGTRRCISPSAFFPTARRRYWVSGLEWLRRVPRSDQRRTSRDDRSDLHRRPAPQLDELRVVEGSQPSAQALRAVIVPRAWPP